MSHPALGKTYPPFEYEVCREKIREYSHAIGATNPVHFDREAAKGAGFRDVVAPPMFAVVYSAGSVGPGVLDPALGINLALRPSRRPSDGWKYAATPTSQIGSSPGGCRCHGSLSHTPR